MEFEIEPWLRVIARDENAARKFFSAPHDWPVKFLGFDARKVGRVYGVLSEGLEIK